MSDPAEFLPSEQQSDDGRANLQNMGTNTKAYLPEKYIQDASSLQFVQRQYMVVYALNNDFVEVSLFKVRLMNLFLHPCLTFSTLLRISCKNNVG